MTVTDTTFSLEISRRFAVPHAKVFDAWLSKKWGEWLLPKLARCEVARIEPEAGGSYLIRTSIPDGRNIEISGKHKEIARPTKLVLHRRAITTIK
jgi:uncharacterized protein YndB with AHSA1/START domain